MAHHPRYPRRFRKPRRTLAQAGRDRAKLTASDERLLAEMLDAASPVGKSRLPAWRP